MPDDNLDSHLFPKNSPYNTRENFVTAYDFDVTHQIPAGGINYTNLTAASRAATAVISLSGEKGTFKDIQAAINYVNSLGGGRILVLPGTYTITQSIMLYGDITIEGLSTADCIFDFNSTTNNFSATNISNLTLRNLTFQNCHNTLTGTIYLNVAVRILIDHCAFAFNETGGSGCDIYVVQPSFLKVTFCTSTSPATFYYADEGGGINEISFNSITSSQNYTFQGGTTGVGGGRTRYSTNVINTPVKSAFFGKYQIATLDGNYVNLGSTATQVCIDMDSGSDISLTNNRFSNSQVNGQAILDLNTMARVFCVGNWFLASKDNTPGILFTSCTDSSISSGGIDVAGGVSGSDCIKLVSCNNVQIIGNRIHSAGSGTSYGVNIPSGSDFNIVVGNGITAPTADTINGGSGNIIANNS